MTVLPERSTQSIDLAVAGRARRSGMGHTAQRAERQLGAVDVRQHRLHLHFLNADAIEEKHQFAPDEVFLCAETLHVLHDGAPVRVRIDEIGDVKARALKNVPILVPLNGGQIVGFGFYGYVMGMRALLEADS